MGDTERPAVELGRTDGEIGSPRSREGGSIGGGKGGGSGSGGSAGGSNGSGSRSSGGSDRSGERKPSGGRHGKPKSGSDRSTGGDSGSLHDFQSIDAPFGLGELGAKPVAKGGDKRPEYRVLAQATIVTAFNSIEIWTGHEHWHKECEDVEPIVGPLCRMVEALPKSTLKAFEKRFNGLMLLGGAMALVIPDTLQEVRIRNAERAFAKADAEANRRGIRLVNTKGEVVGGFRGDTDQPVGGNGGERSEDDGNGDWASTLAPSDLRTAYKFGGS